MIGENTKMKMNLLITITILLIPQSILLAIAMPSSDLKADRTNSSHGASIVNRKIYTIVDYHGQQIDVYKALSNDPKNQIYYYMPIIFPKKSSENWIRTSGRGELRLTVTFDNEEINEMVRKKVKKIGETGSFDVTSLTVDSFSAFVVSANSEPVPGVHRFRSPNPNDKIMTIRFQCSSKVVAEDVMSHIINGDYNVEFVLFFASFNKVSTNIYASTIGDSLNSIRLQTTNDGENSMPTYIHRTQANKFISIYLINVRKIIYKEDPKSNTSILTDRLEEQFVSLMQQAMSNLTIQEKLDLDMYEQIWSSNDLKPDRLTSELNKIFTYNQAETEYRNTNDKYFTYNKEYANLLTKSKGFKSSTNIFGKISEDMDISESIIEAISDATGETTHDVISSTDIQKYLGRNSIETEWDEEKIILKSFLVYRLADIIDNLQVALTARELTAEKTNNTVTRILSTLNLPLTSDRLTETTVVQSSTIITGEIRLYSVDTHPPFPWLFCNGTAILRTEYQRLFNLIGIKYGSGNGITTFNLPDFRGRIPLGVDPLAIRVRDANHVGASGGKAEHNLSIQELPSHQHDKGSMALSTDGDHSHFYHDPGHGHDYSVPSPTVMDQSNVKNVEWHTNWGKGFYHKWERKGTFPGYVGIQIHDAGAHSHSISGQTASVGNGQKFSLMNPFQTVNYIIYAN